MEAFLLTILSILAFIGIAWLVYSIYYYSKTKTLDAGYKFIFLVPENSESKLEGIIRRIYLEKIPEKLMTDGKVYLVIHAGNDETVKIANTLKKMYPLEVLQDSGGVLYDIINRN